MSRATPADAPPRLPHPIQRTLARMGLPVEDFDQMAGPLGVTPRDTIHTQGTLKLHHYRPLAESVYRTPVLIVTSLVNQPYILDLVPGQSMVEYLLRHGYDVYLIEWGRPRREHQHLVLEGYVLERATERISPDELKALRALERDMRAGRGPGVIHAALPRKPPCSAPSCAAPLPPRRRWNRLKTAINQPDLE